MVSIPEHARCADRNWILEYRDLLNDGYVGHDEGACFDRRDYDTARRTACVCGEDMDFRGFELNVDGLSMYRAYALCVMCGFWFEF